jgi:hypothetical protein
MFFIIFGTQLKEGGMTSTVIPTDFLLKKSADRSGTLSDCLRFRRPERHSGHVFKRNFDS